MSSTTRTTVLSAIPHGSQAYECFRRELIFEVREAPEGGYTARALGESIFTETDDWASLESEIRNAVDCHYNAGERPARGDGAPGVGEGGQPSGKQDGRGVFRLWGQQRQLPGGRMPEISRFFGIVIRMFYAEHGVPHFHARYGRKVISVRIDGLSVLSGSLPPRALGMVLEWAALHQAELLENWERLRRARRPRPIPPLQ